MLYNHSAEAAMMGVMAGVSVQVREGYRKRRQQHSWQSHRAIDGM